MKYLNSLINYSEPPLHWWKSVMPLFLSEIAGTFQVASVAAGEQVQNDPGPVQKSELRTLLQLRPSETNPNCNISPVDTHCKHQLHCTECPFTGDDVYRRLIFNLLSAILNGERWIYEIQRNKWVNPLTGSVLSFLFVWFWCHHFVLDGS